MVLGVERTAEMHVFMERVENRSAATLEKAIARHVAVGSHVYTDLWKGYSSFTQNLQLEHKTVNHLLFFKDPVTSVHTNTVEGTNNALKIIICTRNRTSGIDDHVSEFVWRRNQASRPWDAFIEALRDIHYDIE